MPKTIASESNRCRTKPHIPSAGLGLHFPDGIERVLELDEHARGPEDQGHNREHGGDDSLLRFVRGLQHARDGLRAFVSDQA
jgi:hypothetical protein